MKYAKESQEFYEKGPPLVRFPDVSCSLLGTVQGERNVLEMEFHKYEREETVSTQAY